MLMRTLVTAVTLVSALIISGPCFDFDGVENCFGALNYSHAQMIGAGEDELIDDLLEDLHIPDLHLDECMPLWPLLRAQIARTRDRELLPVGLVVALHAALLSVVAVNGDERCAEVGATLKVGVAELRADTRDAQRALAAVDDKYGTLVTQNAKLGDWWLEQVWDRATTRDPTGGRSFAYTKANIASTRDASGGTTGSPSVQPCS